MAEVAEGVADELRLACLDGVGDATLGVGQGVGSELLEEGLKAQRQQGGVFVGAEDEVGKQGEGAPKRSASGIWSVAGTPGEAQGGGGMKNQVTGRSKVRAKATISSASKLRMRPPSTERSAADAAALRARPRRFRH